MDRIEMLEQLYALGVICIQYVQEWFADSKEYLETVNNITNPNNALEYIFPFVSIFDSVFAAQFAICMAFGHWLNAIMKWLLLEDRPYWWVRETTFYGSHNRPQLQQSPQTCETGPGCPSGHTTMVAMQLILYIMWISHIMNDRNYYIWWWKYVVYPAFAVMLGSVVLARMFVATHFPHQCLLALVIGLLLTPTICLYITDPYIWGYSLPASYLNLARSRPWNVAAAVTTIAFSFIIYHGLKISGIDPQWTVNLAFRWCENPRWIHVSTTPMYTLVLSTASMLGWAVCVTPAVAQYRHYTKRRSLLISMAATILIYCIMRELQAMIDKKSALNYYICQFVLHFFKPIIYLRAVPWLAMWPYSGGDKKYV